MYDEEMSLPKTDINVQRLRSECVPISNVHRNIVTFDVMSRVVYKRLLIKTSQPHSEIS